MVEASGRPARVVICYPLVNAYMAACWRELAAREGIDLFVIGFQSGSSDLVAFSAAIMDGVPHRLLSGDERRDAALVSRIVREQAPDVLMISGWSEKAFRPLYSDAALAAVPKVLMMDNQRRYSLRQAAGKLVLRPLVKRVAHWFVTGERAWQFARFLGVPERSITRGVVSVNYRDLAPLLAQRSAMPGGWPRRFLFVGRYHSRKALDVLVEAYGQYRAAVVDPWPLVTAGMGPEARLLAGVDGVEDKGFLPPEQLPGLFRDAGALVLPSRYDAWPLTIVEACASGLPVIATEECGSAVEVVRNLYNGRVVPTDDVAALAGALRWIHDHHADLPKMGARGQAHAEPFGAEAWADRAVFMLASLA